MVAAETKTYVWVEWEKESHYCSPVEAVAEPKYNFALLFLRPTPKGTLTIRVSPVIGWWRSLTGGQAMELQLMSSVTLKDAELGRAEVEMDVENRLVFVSTLPEINTGDEAVRDCRSKRLFVSLKEADSDTLTDMKLSISIAQNDDASAF